MTINNENQYSKTAISIRSMQKHLSSVLFFFPQQILAGKETKNISFCGEKLILIF